MSFDNGIRKYNVITAIYKTKVPYILFKSYIFKAVPNECFTFNPKIFKLTNSSRIRCITKPKNKNTPAIVENNKSNIKI